MFIIHQGREVKRKFISLLILTMIVSMFAPLTTIVHADGAVYYVGGAGASDENPGTAEAPFATIQKAADVATAGDTVKIRTGTYRETIIPANSGTAGSPIVYEPDGDAVVTVSGADAADGGWTQHSGNIYKKTISMTNGYNDNMTNNATLLANQVFVDGKMMIEARWPNVSNSDDLMNRADWRATSNGVWEMKAAGMTVADEGIPDIPGGWAGGQLWMTGWYVSQTREIKAQSGKELTLAGSEIIANKREFYYLTGRLGALDTAKEWHYDGTDLYLWAPDGNEPEGVEVKARNYAFDLSGKSHITLNNLHIFAATILTDYSSSNVTIDGLKARYINHNVTLTDSDVIYTHTDQAGIRLIGPNSIIKNSVVEYSSNMGIVLGAGNIAQNNLVHDIGYDGTYASGISPLTGTSNQKILQNTVFRVGRSAVDMLHTQNVEIGYNDFYDYGLITNDGGAIYSARQTDLTGTEVHHNWIHNSKALRGGQGGEKGIYYDQGSGPALTHHNVLWGNEEDYYNHHDPLDQVNPPKVFETYNNTFGSMEYASYVTYQIPPTDIAANNIYRDAILASDNATFAVKQNVDPKFKNLDADHGGLKYQLLADSPAVNKGKVIPGVTDGFVGSAPDIGAYELGGEVWVPGYQAEGWVPDYYASEGPLPPTMIDEDALSPQGTVIIDDAVTGTGDFQYEFVGAWKTSANPVSYKETDHYTKTADDYYVVRFTGTQIHVYGEKNNAFGISAMSVDDGAETLVDGYNPTQMADTLLYSSPILPYGSHTLKVRLTGDKNEASAGTYHTADKVLVVTGAVTIDDAVTGTGDFQYEFVGNWRTSANADAFKETDHYNDKKDDYYTVNFTGTQIHVYGEKRNSFGIVAISMDGGEETLVDAYSDVRLPNTLLYVSPVLPYGSHTLKVRLTGDKNAESTHTYHTADRVIVVTDRVTIDDADEGVELYHYDFVGNWRTSANVDAYKETDHYNDKKDDYYTVTFTGSQIHVYGEKRNSFGIAAISIDGGEETLVDAYSEVRLPNTLLYVSPVLPHGTHTIKVRLTGERNELSTHTYHTADRVVITTAALPEEPAPDTTSPEWPAVANLIVSNVGQSAVTLTWPAATDDTAVTKYYVYRGGAEAPIAEVAGDVQTHRVTGLTANRTYSFTVVAADEAGNVSEGLSATATTLAVPTAPSTPTPAPTATPTSTPKPTPTPQATATAAPQPMPEDAEEHWSADAVSKLAELGAITVDEEGNFRPEQQSTRAEFIDMLVKALKLQPKSETGTFADTEQHWAKESIAIAKQLGLINGYSDTTFGPEDEISREQMAVILVRALGLEQTEPEGAELSFTDADQVSPWAAQALAIAVEQGLIRGYPNGSFQPQRALSRAEAAAIIVRILDRSTD